jgi:hypothetical protein
MAKMKKNPVREKTKKIDKLNWVVEKSSSIQQKV